MLGGSWDRQAPVLDSSTNLFHLSVPLVEIVRSGFPVFWAYSRLAGQHEAWSDPCVDLVEAYEQVFQPASVSICMELAELTPSHCPVAAATAAVCVALALTTAGDGKAFTETASEVVRHVCLAESILRPIYGAVNHGEESRFSNLVLTPWPLWRNLHELQQTRFLAA
mmetsp:Transcript_59765/g.159956  ORF Transcript_59765/g.159956 Transcript_59765/m.159956 type:complete len:167 (+) Transcript_59765:176-676(+)